jgi:hypothetical protein
MKAPGETDPLYVVARTVLLDALEALGAQRNALILVGAQAVYVHTGGAGLAIAEFTSDADIALDPRHLTPDPGIDTLMEAAGFFRGPDGSGAPAIGTWSSLREISGVTSVVSVDLMVPEALSGRGRRSADIPPHTPGSARRALGLEGCVVDRDLHRIGSFDPRDGRTFEVDVAGQGALLLAKVTKIAERADAAGLGRKDRTKPKDALDVYRLLAATPSAELARRYDRLLAADVSAAVAQRGLASGDALFSSPNSSGCRWAAEAAAPFEEPDVIAASAASLWGAFRRTTGRRA